MVYGKPERSSQSFEFRCVWKSFKEVLYGKVGDILTTNSDGKVDFFELPRKHSGVRTHLKMIDQPSGVLEYDAVGAIDHKFREAVSYNMYEILVLRPPQDVAHTMQSQARTRARHTQTYPRSSWADLMRKNSNAERFPSLLTLRPEPTQHSNA
jgi:hypothetical protein